MSFPMLHDASKKPMDYRKYIEWVKDKRAMRAMDANKRMELQEFCKNQSILIPTRVNGKQTSLKIRTSVAAMHCFIIGGEDIKHYKQFLMDAVYRICQGWYGEDGRGLSGYVTDTLLMECLDREEGSIMNYITVVLNEECFTNGSPTSIPTNEEE